MKTTYFQLESGSIVGTTQPSIWAHDKGAIRLPSAKAKRLLKAESTESLLKILRPGDTVYCVLKHVSASGMRRHIDLYVIIDKPMLISGHVANVLDMRLANSGGLVTDGCGMDMGGHLVTNLGMALWPNGTPAPHGTRNGTPDNSGGYALRARWL